MRQTRPVSPIEFKDNSTEKMSSVSNTGYFQCVPNFTFARLRNFGRQLLKGPVKKEEGFFARSKTSADVSKNKHIKVDLCTLHLSIESFLQLPGVLLLEVLKFLSPKGLVSLEAVFGVQVDTELAWKRLCYSEGLTSRVSLLSAGNIVIANRPSPKKLKWKQLYALKKKSYSKEKRYLSYRDDKNRKYIVFVKDR